MNYPATIIVLFGAMACAAAEPPALTTIQQVRDSTAAQAGSPIRIRGVLTYHDPSGRTLFLEDHGVGLYINVPTNLPLIHVGNTIEVTGRRGAVTRVEDPEVREIGDGLPPNPLPVSGNTLSAGGFDNRLVEIRGVVRSAIVEGSHAIIRLESERHLFRVFVRHLPTDDPPVGGLVDAEVRITAVCGVTGSFGGKSDIKLMAHRLADVRETRPAAATFSAPLYPAIRLPDWSAHRIRVSGTATGSVAEGILTLRDDTGEVSVAVAATLVARAGERFEAIGFVGRRDGRSVLTDAVVRGFALRAGVSAEAALPADFLPVIQSVTELRRMTPEDAARGHPVKFRSTVTYHQPAAALLFVHDRSEGVYVYQEKGDQIRVPEGTLVEVDGYSDPGMFAPCVWANHVTFLRPGRLPEPRRVGLSDLVGGREDSQWVEVEGVVRGAAPDLDGDGVMLLRVGSETAHVIVRGAKAADMRRFTGATVRVRGVCGSYFDDRRNWTGMSFLLAGPELIAIRKEAPTDLFALPTGSVESLAKFDPDRGPGERVKIAGTVILRRNATVVVQDETGGISVDLQPGQPGNTGERVEVHGFLIRRGGEWGVEDGLAQIVERGRSPNPSWLAVDDVLGGGHAATLVRIEGVLVDHLTDAQSDHVFLLRSDAGADGSQVIFSAVLDRERVPPELANLRSGTRLAMTGACSAMAERQASATFRIFLRDASDVTVVSRPPWWNAANATGAAGLIAALASAALAWVWTLRRRVRLQTSHMVERLKREARLEEQYRETVETASDAIFSLDAAGRVIAINPAGERLTGLAADDAFLDAVTPASARDAHDLIACEVPVTREVGLAGPSGAVLLEVNARPVVHDGQWAGVRAIARDLTQRRRLESELRQAQKMEAIGRLAGGIAHDFNNLLTVINGNAEVLRYRLGPDELGLADEIVRAGDQAATLTRQLLAFSRKSVLSPKVLCPNDTVESVRNVLARLVGERVELITALDDAVGCVKIDPGQLEQALLNLAVNARDAMPTGGTLTIRTRAWIGHARIEVADTGVGMDEATKARVFEPFFTTKPVGEGTGLGLATVQTILEQAGGAVGVRSAPGQGTTFFLDLPLCGEAPCLDEDVAPGPLATSNREVILLVEDEPSVQLLQRRVLEMGKYEVLAAACGEDALILLGGHGGPIDLLMTDVVMPGMNGRELAEEVARRRPGMKTLFLSGYTPDEVLRQGIEAETAHFLQKPFTPSSLLGKVRDVLDYGKTRV